MAASPDGVPTMSPLVTALIVSSPPSPTGRDRIAVRNAVPALGAGAAHAAKRPYTVTRVNAYVVSTSVIDGQGRSIVRLTFTRRTPPLETTTRGRQ